MTRSRRRGGKGEQAYAQPPIDHLAGRTRRWPEPELGVSWGGPFKRRGGLPFTRNMKSAFERSGRGTLRSPRLSTRLLLPLIATVAAIMAAYAALTLVGRERAVRAEVQREARAYATALDIALESAFESRDPGGAARILDRITLEPRIYGVIVYGPDGRPLYVTNPVTRADASAPAEVLSVLRSGQEATLDRRLRGQDVVSVLRPIRGSAGATLGAFETIHPLSEAEAEIQRTRVRLLLATLALLAALFLVIHWFVRRVVTRPLDRFVEAVRAVREGDLSRRVPPSAASREIAALGDEFNVMADHLQAAREEVVREGDERVELERRLRDTEKLAAIGQLAAGLAHEIGTPLNVVAGRAEMLLRREEDPERQRKLHIIIDQIDRITRTVRSLLDFARRREPHPEVADLGPIVDGVLEFLEGEAARAHVRIEREGLASAWARVDPYLIHELILNLLVNAIHAVESVPGERRVVVRLLGIGGVAGGGGRHVLEIEDNGPGIEANAMPHLFEPFYTTKTGNTGTGLGLPVAKAIAEEHGGTIEALNVHSARAPDRSGVPAAGERDEGLVVATGAVFRVTLPAIPDEATHA